VITTPLYYYIIRLLISRDIERANSDDTIRDKFFVGYNDISRVIEVTGSEDTPPSNLYLYIEHLDSVPLHARGAQRVPGS